MPRGVRLSLVCSFVGFALASCGDSDTGGGGPTPGCTSDADCAAGQVCQPFSQTCEVPGMACTDHTQCVGGTYCEASNMSCLPSSTGSPCAGPANCDGDCFGGFCGCSGLAHERQLEGGPLDVYLVL